MRGKFMRHLIAAAMALPLFAAPMEGGSAAGPRNGTVTLLHVNDFHGRHMPVRVAPGNATAQTGDPGREPQEFERAGTVGGIAHLATVVQRIRQERGADHVILVHGGDAFSDDLLGNLTRGEAMVRMMDAVGVRFMAFGNHDFDYGAERTRELQEMVRFQMRGANVLDRTTGQPFLGDPTMVVDTGGIRVGLLALGYHNTPLTTDPDNVASLSFTDGIEAARRHVPEIRARADVVVVVSHQGTKVDRELAPQVPGIDVIVAAHSHDDLQNPDKVGETRIVQAASDGTVLGEVEIRVADGKLAGVRATNHTLWSADVPADPQVTQIIEDLRAPFRERLTEVIATARDRIGRRYRSESPFDRLVGDILRTETGAEVALLPGVGYGVSIGPGPVTREDLYALLPHPSRVVTLKLTGAQLREVLERSAANQKPERPQERVGGLVQTAGLRWSVDLNRPRGQRVDTLEVDGKPFDDARLYSVVTHTGMLKGTHGYTTFQGGQDVHKLDRKVTEIVETALRAMEKVASPALGDVRLVKAASGQ
ncbi:multifunctional 2',3'-cyclic-nucleotide 2'-phosphodiesterase/5'-nucleotidase/3'-nucleotidase [Roseomonas genomospecies 6]|uniref:Multifunctional 2',3'-cyclic-nucleotide 2'-phosphodiesterase/5'-nucleotidase/3'-nucleotidase n=2 Tax=Roseomonas genomospecies 6 TaxID=214106 RepID=A0A9W7NIC5_9PROT|nr:multifunctional 2',3'-cyclic-nucleotide 2'-phosphodiesterase/5'-nucleotidase/3'-nucleotidase [Roseomonas genomospecies 6]